jgi:hypothetical protein
MNRTRNTRSHHTRIVRYALEGPRWWWTPAAGGTVVTTALVAILTSAAPGSAIPIEVDRYAASTSALPATSTAIRQERVPVAEPPDLPDGWRQCFMWQSHWNTALDGPQPLCPEDPDGEEAHEGQARRTATGNDHARTQTVGQLTELSPRGPSRATWLPIP